MPRAAAAASPSLGNRARRPIGMYFGRNRLICANLQWLPVFTRNPDKSDRKPAATLGAGRTSSPPRRGRDGPAVVARSFPCPRLHAGRCRPAPGRFAGERAVASGEMRRTVRRRGSHTSKPSRAPSTSDNPASPVRRAGRGCDRVRPRRSEAARTDLRQRGDTGLGAVVGLARIREQSDVDDVCTIGALLPAPVCSRQYALRAVSGK
jgi:hypothetical protein